MMKLLPTQETSTLFSFIVSAVQHCQLWLCQRKGRQIPAESHHLSVMDVVALFNRSLHHKGRCVIVVVYSTKKKKNQMRWIITTFPPEFSALVLLAVHHEYSSRD